MTLGEFAENACRKDFTPSEIAAIAKVIRPLEEERSRRRRLHGLRNQEVEVADCHDEGKTRDIVARYTGISGRTLDKITAVVEAAEEDACRLRPPEGRDGRRATFGQSVLPEAEGDSPAKDRPGGEDRAG